MIEAVDSTTTIEQEFMLTVIVCTHNPRFDYLQRTLEGLKNQSLAQKRWELIVVDNASVPALEGVIDLSWHVSAKVLVERNLGLTPARLCGIRQARAPLLVFVDDDNVLQPDYLETALRIADEYPFLGAWGGHIALEFETPPPEWTRSFWPFLAERHVPRALWSNLFGSVETVPWGAGMCVRTNVGRAYVDQLAVDGLRERFDRRGQQLTSGGDIDLALTACDLGLGTGVFPELRLSHLIPPARLKEEYLLRLVEGTHYSMVLVMAKHAHKPSRAPIRPLRRLLGRCLRFVTFPARKRRFFEARLRGEEEGLRQLLSNSASK